MSFYVNEYVMKACVVAITIKESFLSILLFVATIPSFINFLSLKLLNIYTKFLP